MIEKKFDIQVKKGERFEFGKNWNNFLRSLSKDQIKIAESSLKEMLEIEDLSEKTFLDVGCGSGLFSLSAKNLNAKVYSFDFDIESVKCTEYLKKTYYPNSEWRIEEKSILDSEEISKLAKFDIVYSWGVLHHTGNLFLGMENVTIPLKSDGKLFIAIYNDQGPKSAFWLRIKKIYNYNFLGKFIVLGSFIPVYILIGLAVDVIKFKNPFRRFIEYKKNRGMSIIHDWNDWLGGFPYEVASPEFVVDFYKKRGFQLEKIRTTNSLGCNQFVFKKIELKNNMV